MSMVSASVPPSAEEAWICKYLLECVAPAASASGQALPLESVNIPLLVICLLYVKTFRKGIGSLHKQQGSQAWLSPVTFLPKTIGVSVFVQ